MKKVIMKVAEFMQFQQVAQQYKILFDYSIKAGNVTITATEKELAIIGY